MYFIMLEVLEISLPNLQKTFALITFSKGKTSMKNLDNIDWRIIWGFVKDIVLPHTGTLILSTVLFALLGLIIGIIYVVILYRKKMLKRIPKYYNWAAKLYIPLLIIGFTYILGQVGFLRGVYKVLNKEEAAVVSKVYESALNATFEDEKSKKEFVASLQHNSMDFMDVTDSIIDDIAQTTKSASTGYTLLDNGKDKLTNYLVKNYGDDLVKVAAYGVLTAAGARAHVDITEEVPYEDFSKVMDVVMLMGHKDIEKAIKGKLTVWVDETITSQYKGMRMSLLILLLVLALVPIIEFFIYKKWIEPRYKIASNEEKNERSFLLKQK